MAKRMENKVAVITGGARGIGAATVTRLAEENAEVFIFDTLKEEGEILASKIKASGGKVDFIQVDVTDETSVSQAIAAVIQQYGRIDALVNNAAITGVNKMAHEVSVDEWNQVFDVNVKGVFLCTKYAVREMIKKRQGSIVNFSSIYGLIGNNDLPPYHATKGAVLMMTKTDAICYAPYGIRVNAVHPGSTKTELFMKAAESYVDGKEVYLDMMKEKHPLCLGEPVDVANCVLFLASEEARFVTGASLVVDGGYTAQ